ncbi:S41 family peptidase [Novipirellula aureliae]|nr:S41 family peptidase [Novipirellula aureliae]
MPPRNLTILIIAFLASSACYVTHRRAKTAIMVGDAMEMINNYYVDPVEEDQLLVAAMNGMTSLLDQNSEYITSEYYESFRNSIQQEFAGIGIYVDQPVAGEPVRIITPLVGSPAIKAGLLPADQIIRVDGRDVSEMSLGEVTAALKGVIGTTVEVRIRRRSGEDGGWKEMVFTVERATIELESVIGSRRGPNDEWIYRLEEDSTIAYIRLTSFGDRTIEELRKVLVELDNDFRGMVIDVRGNGGGLLYSAIDIADMFLESGAIVSTRVRGGKIEAEYEAKPGTLVAVDKPLAVLIDENSASASEILAAALKDNKRATIVGTRSYGKGTVQNVLPLQYGRSALKLTVARYYRPNGKNIHRSKEATEEDEWGVSPDDSMRIELDDKTRLALVEHWTRASYPSLSEAALEEVRAKFKPANPEEDESIPDAEIGASIETGSLMSIDPQLRKAVESLRSH